MLREVVYRGLDAAPRLTRALENGCERIDRQVSRFDGGVATLRLVLESRPDPPQATVAARLTLRGGVLFGREQHRDPVTAVNKAFRDLRDQLERHASQVRRLHLRRRTGKVAGGAVPEATGPPVVPTGPLDAEQIARLSRFVRREILHRHLDGSLPFGVLPDAIVDDTVVLALEEADEKPPRLSYNAWLLSLARRALDRRTALAVGEDRRTAAVEWEATAAGLLPSPSDDDILDFFHPDDRPSVGDVTVDRRAASPEQEAAGHELRLHVHRILGQMPISWRHAFTLCTIEGQTVAAVASSLAERADAVRRRLEMAAEFLREKLHETGYRARL